MKVLNKPVDMIAYHSAEGVPTPVKFKIKDRDEAVTVKVDRVVTYVQIKLGGQKIICYTCESVIDGIEKRYELRFYPDTVQWVVYKM